MASFKALCLAGIASFAVTAPVFAADLPLPLPPPPPFYEPPVAIAATGLYLRGDLGAGDLQLRGSNSTFDQSAIYPNGSQPPGFAYNGSSLAEQAVLGVGVGYQFTNYFRADLTGEYRVNAKYNAVETALGCGPAGASYYCADQYGGHVSSAVVLVNGYVDLGTWYNITPYIGAGIGTSINTFSGLTDYNLTYQNGAASGYASSKTRASLAYAGMAGITYAMTPNLKLDFGYRYLDMGRLSSNAIACNVTSGCGFERQNYHMSSHDIRIGLRYQFADLIPYAPPPPLIRKY